jgi:hypothetical protein
MALAAGCRLERPLTGKASEERTAQGDAASASTHQIKIQDTVPDGELAVFNGQLECRPDLHRPGAWRNNNALDAQLTNQEFKPWPREWLSWRPVMECSWLPIAAR